MPLTRIHLRRYTIATKLLFFVCSVYYIFLSFCSYGCTFSQTVSHYILTIMVSSFHSFLLISTYFEQLHKSYVSFLQPKQQKVTKYLHAPTVRCAPSIFNSFIDLLTMSQRTRINNMNFSGLLQIRTDKLVSREMLKYFYDRLDPDTMVLVLGKDRVIHINPFAVKQAFDIPDSGEELSLHTNQ